MLHIPLIRGVKMEILNLNCISINDKMYEIDPNNEDEKPYIKVFYTDADDIIIAGMIAYHGVYWLSVTDIKETDTIRKIFAYVSALIPTKCANIHAVIGNTYYNDEQLKLFPYNFPAAADEIFSHYSRIKDSFNLSGAFEKSPFSKEKLEVVIFNNCLSSILLKHILK